jgi:hypothetical protein
LITAWDSTFRLPQESHEPVLLKLCDGLAKNGVILFSCGGGEERGNVQGEFGGERVEYSSLGIPEFIRLLWRFGCAIQHVEYDQYPETMPILWPRRLSDDSRLAAKAWLRNETPWSGTPHSHSVDISRSCS